MGDGCEDAHRISCMNGGITDDSAISLIETDLHLSLAVCVDWPITLTQFSVLGR